MTIYLKVHYDSIAGGLYGSLKATSFDGFASKLPTAFVSQRKGHQLLCTPFSFLEIPCQRFKPLKCKLIRDASFSLKCMYMLVRAVMVSLCFASLASRSHCFRQSSRRLFVGLSRNFGKFLWIETFPFQRQSHTVDNEFNLKQQYKKSIAAKLDGFLAKYQLWTFVNALISCNTLNKRVN